MNIEQEILEIKKRNDRVEVDKAWETCKTRAALILIVTYILATVTLCLIGNDKPYINALIPTLGFFLSIQSFPIMKRCWIKKYVPK